MPVSVTLPALGESVTEGTVSRWLKAAGDRVEADEPLVEVSTDKVETEIPAPVSGVLTSIKVAEGESAQVGAELAVIGDDDAPPPQSSRTNAAYPGPPIPPGAKAGPAPAAAEAPAAEAPVPAAAVAAGSPLRGQMVRMTRLRQVIADNMVAALRTSAQLTTVVEADVTGLVRLRAREMDAFAAREGIRLWPMPFFVKAAAEALKVHPVINASLNEAEGTITYHDAEHIGIAVDTERGLLVPVIRNAGDLSVAGIARKTAELAARTRDNKVTPDELAGATFTITNTGSRGALFDTPIFAPPQVAILGIGATVKRPVALEPPGLGPVIVVRDLVYLALSYDHRIVDGADAARFLATVKRRLEDVDSPGHLGL